MQPVAVVLRAEGSLRKQSLQKASRKPSGSSVAFETHPEAGAAQRGVAETIETLHRSGGPFLLLSSSLVFFLGTEYEASH